MKLAPIDANENVVRLLASDSVSATTGAGCARMSVAGAIAWPVVTPAMPGVPVAAAPCGVAPGAGVPAAG